MNPGTVLDYEVVRRWWKDRSEWTAGWIRNGGKVPEGVRTRFSVQEGAQMVAEVPDGGGREAQRAVVQGANELFARGFETYPAEGRAPFSVLKSVFKQFDQWLREIYGKLTGERSRVSLFAGPGDDVQDGGDGGTVGSVRPDYDAKNAGGPLPVLQLNEPISGDYRPYRQHCQCRRFDPQRQGSYVFSRIFRRQEGRI